MKNKVRRHFYLSKDLYGQRLIIKIENQGFYYDHDEIVNANKKRFSVGGTAYISWSRYGRYTKTGGYPNWARAYFKGRLGDEHI